MKGISLNDAGPLLLMIVTIGFLLGGGLLAINGFQKAGATQASTIQNITLSEGVAVPLTYTNIVSVASIVNATNQTQTLPTANYTVDLIGGTITLIGDGYEGMSGRTTYTYYTRDAFYNGTQYSSSSITNFSTQLPTVGTILGIAMIIAVALMAFAYIGGRK